MYEWGEITVNSMRVQVYSVDVIWYSDFLRRDHGMCHQNLIKMILGGHVLGEMAMAYIYIHF